MVGLVRDLYFDHDHVIRKSITILNDKRVLGTRTKLVFQFNGKFRVRKEKRKYF